MIWLFQKITSLIFPLVYAGGASGGWEEPFSGNNSPSSITIENPLGEGATIETLVSRISDFLVLIAIPILSLVVLYSAFQILTARGNESQFESGKKTLLYGLVGFVILLVGEGLVKLLEAIVFGTL